MWVAVPNLINLKLKTGLMPAKANMSVATLPFRRVEIPPKKPNGIVTHSAQRKMDQVICFADSTASIRVIKAGKRGCVCHCAGRKGRKTFPPVGGCGTPRKDRGWCLII
jgi:hypothetical protein